MHVVVWVRIVVCVVCVYALVIVSLFVLLSYVVGYLCRSLYWCVSIRDRKCCCMCMVCV